MGGLNRAFISRKKYSFLLTCILAHGLLHIILASPDIRCEANSQEKQREGDDVSFFATNNASSSTSREADVSFFATNNASSSTSREGDVSFIAFFNISSSTSREGDVSFIAFFNISSSTSREGDVSFIAFFNISSSTSREGDVSFIAFFNISSSTSREGDVSFIAFFNISSSTSREGDVSFIAFFNISSSTSREGDVSFIATISTSNSISRELSELQQLQMQNVAVIVSVLTLTSISVERWFAICKPLTFQQTRTRVIVCMVVIWVVANLASIPRLVMMEVIHDSLIPPNLTVLLTTCAPRDPQFAIHYEIFLVVTFFAIPILVMGYNYTAIAVCLWSSSNTTRHLSEGDQQAIVSQLMARRRTAKMLVVVVIVFFFCFMPNYVWNILRHTVLLQLGAINHLVPAITLITQLLVYTNSCTNPIIYNFMSGKFRKEFRSACACCSHCCRQEKPQQSQVHEMEPLSAKRIPRRDRNNASFTSCTADGRTMVSDCV
ncbi:hypothetical protein RRG08_003751 [Elysia crispata]|uniref:G-protein coupled receptors family 1 profile domain-containing protein n=1 Tax=Elysia crispata TaxID=231223 RepID=A0AAE1AVB7_9GAST|nr:hypothetical protein RRG08_003751 [Elysia crispata]